MQRSMRGVLKIFIPISSFKNKTQGRRKDQPQSTPRPPRMKIPNADAATGGQIPNKLPKTYIRTSDYKMIWNSDISFLFFLCFLCG
jgi:hypothetical protein